jgi:hypothetical protein
MNLSEGYNKRLKELSGIIQEDRKRVEYLRGKFISKYPAKHHKKAEDVFNKIVASDPSKNKQYSQWLLNLFSSDALKLEDLYKATEYLYFFDELKRKNVIPSDKRDIGRFTSLQQLHDLISELGGTGEIQEDEKYLIEDRFFINNGQADLVFENDRWLVVIPKTFPASQFYGCSSQWCTKFPEQFQNYSKDGPLLVIIDKSKLNDSTNTRRYQFHFPSDQFMNFSDQSINLNEFLTNNHDLATGLARFLVEAIDNGYDVLNAEEISKIADKEGKKYLDFEILPPAAKQIILKRIVDKGLIVNQSWLDKLGERELPTYIDNRLRRNGITGFENMWDLANNRQKVYYFKIAASKSMLIPEAVINIADNRMVQFYLGEIAKKGMLLPDYLYNMLSGEIKAEYLNSVSKINIFDLNQISSKQVEDFGDNTAKKIIDRVVRGLSKYPLLLTNEFFRGLSNTAKNYYIGKIFQAYKGDMKAISNALTQYQLKWGKEYGFL